VKKRDSILIVVTIRHGVKKRGSILIAVTMLVTCCHKIHRHHCLGGGGVLLQAGLCKETASIIRGQPPPAPPSGPRAMMQCPLHLLPYCHREANTLYNLTGAR